MIPRILEPEVMDTVQEAVEYNAMDHSEVNRVFIDDLLQVDGGLGNAAGQPGILDVGTGTALIPVELCGRVQGCRIVAIDLAREMLKIGEENCRANGCSDRVHLAWNDAKAMSFATTGQFDVVMSNSIIHHIPEPAGVFREMHRVLRPGGILFVRDLMRPVDEEQLEGFVKTYAGNESEYQQQLFRQSLHAALTVSEVAQILTDCGLSADWVRATSDRHWTVAGILPDSKA